MGRISHAWSDFKRASEPGAGRKQLTSVSGNGRCQYWVSAADGNEAKPLTGSGTFEYWWARNGDIPSTVLDTHSLYMQTLG